MLKKIYNIFCILILCGFVAGGIFLGVTKTDMFLPTHVLTLNAQGVTLGDEEIVAKGNQETKLPILEKYGYVFDGWQTEDGEIVSSIKPNKSQTLTAHFTPLKFDIVFIVDGARIETKQDFDAQIEYKGSFAKSFDGEFYYKFNHWETEDGQTVSLGTVTGDATFVAVFEKNTTPYYVTVKLIAGGIEIPETFTFNYCDKFTCDYDFSRVGMGGFFVNTWFTDANLSCVFDPDSELIADITLYGDFDYILNQGFYKYFSKFNAASTTGKMPINSFEELVCWVEYVQFKSITKSPSGLITNDYKFSLNYKTFSSDEAFNQEMLDAIHASTFAYGGSINYYGYAAPNYGAIGCVKDLTSEEATLVCDPSKSQTYDQVDAALTGIGTGRGSSYSNFNRDKVKNIISVYTSNQLVYALEKGLNPVCVAGSPAENIYKKARKVLNEILNAGMSDVDKLRAMYDWVVLNVSYDNKAVSDATVNSNWYKYESWAAEGVFNSGVAVCDGICKAMVILSNLENIPCVRVTGDNHAWNKVYVNGAWFGLDATHGNVLVKSEAKDNKVGIEAEGNNIKENKKGVEILSHTEFLFTDEYKEAGERGKTAFVTDDYPEISCTTKYDYYANTKYSSGEGEFDLVVENEADFGKLIDFIKTKKGVTTVEFAVTSTAPSLASLMAVATRKGVSIDISFNALTDGFGRTVYIIYARVN